MNLKEIFEEETGKSAKRTIDEGDINVITYSPEYTRWLESKVAQKPEVIQKWEKWEKGYWVGFEAGMEYGTGVVNEG